MKKKTVCVSKSALSRKEQGTHGRRSSLPGKAINRCANMQYYVRVVADIGGDADYTTQPRYCVPVHLPFMPSNRSSARQLQLLQGKIQGHLKRCLSAGTDFHAWLFDPQTDQPGLFVTGLLAVREGHCTKSEADALNRQLMPQVFGEQPVRPFRFLVSVTASAWDWRDDSDDSSEYGEDAEYELLDSTFGGFKEYCLLDADVDDVSIHIFAEGWHAISLDLPFTPTPKSSAVQLRYIESEVSDATFELASEVEVEDLEVWMTDENEAPSLFISGLRGLKEGSLSRKEMNKKERELLDQLPYCLKAHSPAA